MPVPPLYAPSEMNGNTSDRACTYCSNVTTGPQPHLDEDDVLADAPRHYGLGILDASSFTPSEPRRASYRIAQDVLVPLKSSLVCPGVGRVSRLQPIISLGSLLRLCTRLVTDLEGPSHGQYPDTKDPASASASGCISRKN